MTATTTATLNEIATKARLAVEKTKRPHNLVWFELPVSDLPLAIAFYEAVFATELRVDPRFPELAIFPRRQEDSITGALIQERADEANHFSRPSDQGAIVYLNCDGDLDGVLGRTKAYGGTVLQEVAQLPGEMGWIAQIRDLDGNRIGLHASF
ncbi:MAG TPA: VOC family protein [Acidobacteriaceae bacterium]